MNICVYCASSSAVDDVYFDAIRALGRELARRGHGMVFGAGNIGLMGALAVAVRDHGGRTIGVIPGFLNEKGLADDRLDELHVTPDMRARKQKMEDLADAFIACPGGLGTLEEILEIITLKQLGRHDKPCVLLNTKGYFNPLIAQIERGIRERFIKTKYRALYHVTDKPDGALDHIETYKPHPLGDKWFTPDDIPAAVSSLE
ncbi:MAG: TIGR00730 family Rossman fold protein [Candidatus Sumerlaeota bacterium]|nr:TIGR00730 family Rossman fold protein [Candidatus Sumerlaeota bacterium]